MANDREIATAALGIIGNIASCLFFLSSAPTVIRIVKKKSSGGLSGDLYVFKLFNCLLWTFYGLPFIHPHDFWVVLTNSFGCAFALMYIAPYVLYATRKERLSMLWKLCAILASFVIMAVLVLILDKSQGNRIMVVGILCAVVSSGMHTTLLSQLGTAIHTKDTKYLQPTASMAAFLKGAIWTAYGIVNLDMYIVIPNGVGVGIGLIQIIVAGMLIWGGRKDTHEEEDKGFEAIEKSMDMQAIIVAGAATGKGASRRNSTDRGSRRSSMDHTNNKVGDESWAIAINNNNNQVPIEEMPAILEVVGRVPSLLTLPRLQRQPSMCAVVVPIDDPTSDEA